MDGQLRLRIDSLAQGGSGVARDETGRIVFVRGAAPGDLVVATLDSEHDRYAEAAVTEVLEPGPDRAVPPCPYFGVCGGCQWQHVSLAAQRDAKREIVRDSLERIGGIADPRVGETLGTEEGYGYRNKIELSAASDERGGLLLGLRAAGTERIVSIEQCLLLPKNARTSPRALTGALRYLSRGSDLGLARVAVRVASGTPDIEVDLWAQPGPFPRAAAATTVRQAVPGCETVTRVLVRDPVRDRSRAKVEVLVGRGHWRERLGDLEFRVSAPSFFQVNSTAALALTGLVVSEVAAEGDDRVLDLYSGVGTFTLPLAELANEVVAVESSGSALRDLEANLDAAGLDAAVYPGDATRVLGDLGHFDLVVVDPPRAGLDADVIARLAQASPVRIVYVSCDPATLARDANRLAAAGYRFVRATPVDLFPQTFHVETVSVFDLAEQA